MNMVQIPPANFFKNDAHIQAQTWLAKAMRKPAGDGDQGNGDEFMPQA
jgi:hypothetical protein